MDPFSITASIITLIQVSAQVTVLVKQFRDEVSVVDTTLNGILNDVDGFQQVLQSMKETFAQEDIQADVLATGHVGSHWKNLARSLSDGENTLDQLLSLIASVNKSTSFLDASRKQLRFKSAIVQISGFREQIQSYRAALQLSLSTIIVWNQVTLQKSTAKIPDRIMPNLNKLYDQIRNLGADLNAKIGKLESTVANQGFHAEMELISMSNLKECVESAADVVSTASTTLGPEGSERASVRYGSDFGDVFNKSTTEPMQRWMSSHTVYEYDDADAPTLDPSEASTGDVPTVYESDSDSDIEHELVRALFNNGKTRKDQGDLHGAERHLRNCLSRFPSNASYTSLASSQSTLTTGVSKAELLELLTETYCLQGSWTQAKSTMKEKLAITERQTGKKSERFLWDSFRLCEVLMNTKDYTEAQLHGRQALRGFRKLREQGHTGYEKTLALLVQICNEQGNLEDEEAYAALLGSHRAIQNPSRSGPADVARKKESQASSSPNTGIQTCVQEEIAESEQILQPGNPILDETASVNKEDQHGLRKLTPIPPITSQSDQLLLSPLSSSSVEPWSPTMQAAHYRDPSSPLGDSHGETITQAPSPEHPATLTKGVVASQIESANTKHANTETASSSAKLLINLCQQELGQKPIFMIGRGRVGYNCIVFADETRQKIIAKVGDCLTKEEARYSAAAKAYKTLVSSTTPSQSSTSASSRTDNRPHRERTGSTSASEHNTPAQVDQGDPPPYKTSEIPSNLTSPTGFLQDIPEIMLSPVFNEAVIAQSTPTSLSHNHPVRRAASDSRLPQHRISSSVHTLASVQPGVEDPRALNRALVASNTSAHRRAASTSTRLPNWRNGDDAASQQTRDLTTTTTSLRELSTSDGTRRGPKVQPNVTFDTIESSVELPGHSNPDPAAPPSRSFSLFPTSLAKTFSLQDRRSKSDDPNLSKKRSLRFGLSSKRRLPPSVSTGNQTIRTCPLCSMGLEDLNDDQIWSHIDSCLGRPSPPANDTAFELPASESGSYAVELPASLPVNGERYEPTLPTPTSQTPSSLSNLHRAFSKRDLSADKFENKAEAQSASPQSRSPLSHFGAAPLQRQVLLLGDSQSGKTWLSSAWCNGAIPKNAPSSAMSFTKYMGHHEIVLRDYPELHHAPEELRRSSYGEVHAVLLCFDISSPESFEKVEHKWNHEADLYFKNVPKVLVGCKKDINRAGSQTVWTRDAYRLTARISARAYFETSAVTMEGLDVLFDHVAQITRR